MAIRVLIVDDSAVMREILGDIIGRESDMEVVGYADDPLIAREKIKALNPDVVTLDIEMPRMDGITFLEKLMRLRPTPVVMISALTEANASATLRALELGAMDYVTKPAVLGLEELPHYRQAIAEKIRFAASRKEWVARRQIELEKTQLHARSIKTHSQNDQQLIFIGASTGGIDAVKQILVQMPAESPPIVIVQHLPEVFTAAFAKRMDNLCEISVKEAEHNDRLMPGCAYVAPGHSHLTLARAAKHFVLHLNQEAPVNRHRPSVDHLFLSVAKVAGRNTIGVLLTGMGRDGAEGLLAMRKAGAFTIAQDEESCVVFGMPRTAIEIGAVMKVTPLRNIATQIANVLNSGISESA
jgi:two-component system chemotaxis response regulator CheB